MRIRLHGPGLALHVHQHQGGARLAPRPWCSSGSPVKAVMSLMMRAPAATAAAITPAWRVSIETQRPRSARARTTGSGAADFFLGARLPARRAAWIPRRRR